MNLSQHLIAIATNKNDVVFDPFMGVGSTGIAAIEMEREFIGIEIEKEYYVELQGELQDSEKARIEQGLKARTITASPCKITIKTRINNFFR